MCAVLNRRMKRGRGRSARVGCAEGGVRYGSASTTRKNKMVRTEFSWMSDEELLQHVHLKEDATVLETELSQRLALILDVRAVEQMDSSGGDT